MAAASRILGNAWLCRYMFMLFRITSLHTCADGCMQVLKRVEVLSQAANSAVANRKQLWQVLSQWEAVCDQLYSQPCTKHTAGGLLPALQPVLTELAAQVEAIKVGLRSVVPTIG